MSKYTSLIEVRQEEEIAQIIKRCYCSNYADYFFCFSLAKYREAEQATDKHSYFGEYVGLGES